VEAGTLLTEGDLRLSAFPVTHRGPGCFGFLFEESPRRPFLPERAESLGVPAGPIRRELVQGRPVRLADGRIIQPDDVLGPLTAGTRLVHVGDCGRTEGLLEVCQGADALVIEATYLDVEVDMAREFGHLTARQAAGLAREAEVRQLFLTHISRRYRESEVLQEAAAIFPQTTVVRDFDTVQVRRSD
jgi:ribonuclease Z